MKSASTELLIELGERYGFDAETTRSLADQVEANLDALDALDDIAVFDDETAGENRTWSDAPTGEENPNNALITRCHVSPTGNGSLNGYEVGVKDNVAVAGVRMTGGSRAFDGFVPSTDATVVSRLLDSGATITAKTNLDELGNVGQGSNTYRGPVRNPHNPDHSAGGSSGGSAAAVAGGLVDAAIGSDTGGSVRIPACFCGLVGLKPTHGLVPVDGFLENTHPHDTVGPITKMVGDAGRLLDAMADDRGADDRSTYFDAATDPPDAEDLSIGVLDVGFEGATEPAVAERVRAALGTLEDAGASLESVDVPHFEDTGAMKNAIGYQSLAATWRAGSVPYRRVAPGEGVDPFRPDVGRRLETSGNRVNDDIITRLLTGAYLLETDYGQRFTRATAAAEVLRTEFESALSGVDVLTLPTMPTTTPTVEDCANFAAEFDYGQNQRYGNLTGLPAITIPAGRVDGLPVGLQIVGPMFDERTLLGVATRVIEST